MLSDYARAMAAWSSPDGIDEHELEPELFKLIAHKPLSRHQLSNDVNRLFTLLDLAMDSAWQKCSKKEYMLLERLWSDAYEDWGVSLGANLNFYQKPYGKLYKKMGLKGRRFSEKGDFEIVILLIE